MSPSQQDHSRWPRPAGRARRKLAGTVGAVSALALASLPLVVAPATASADTPAAAQATVNVDLSQTMSRVGPLAYGLNTALWDPYMTDAATVPLLQAAGIKALRFPGGSYGDIYDWQTNTCTQSCYIAPGDSFQSFASYAQQVGASPTIIVNYGTGTPDEAAAWVKYADVTHNYGAEYWEVGNEQYGNGTYYSPGWEANNWGCGAWHYADEYLKFYQAMKAADPTIKVGVVLTTPGNWPDSFQDSYSQACGDTNYWNQTVLSAIGDNYDFAIVHWYPYVSSSYMDIFNQMANVPKWVASLRSLMSQYVSDVGSKQILLTEFDSGAYRDGQVAAMWGPLNESAWLSSGVSQVDWFDEHNGEGAVDTGPDGQVDYEDQGIFSNASNWDGAQEPPVDTPFRTYYGLVLQNHFAPPSSTFVGDSSTSSDVYSYATHGPHGEVNVLLVNPSLTNSYDVNVTVEGNVLKRSVTVESYTDTSSQITTSTQSASQPVPVPPFSVEVVHISPDSLG